MDYGHESVSRRCFVGSIGRKIQRLPERYVYSVLFLVVGIESAKLDDKNLRGSDKLQALYKLGCRYMLAFLATPARPCSWGKYVFTKELLQRSWVLQIDPENLLRIRLLRFFMATGTFQSLGHLEFEQGFDNRPQTIAGQHSNR